MDTDNNHDRADLGAGKGAELDAHKTPTLPKIQPHSGESCAGFLMRLSEAFGWETLGGTAARLGVTVGDLRWGPRQRKGNSARLCGHQLPLKIIDLHRRRICPCCLKEDRFLREWWEINIFSTCPMHGVVLEESCSCGRRYKWDDTRLGQCPDCKDDVRETSSTRVECTRLELWLARRLGILSAGDEPMELENQKLGFALRLIENVGLMSMYGFSKFAPGSPESVDERNGAMELGLEALSSSGLESIVRASVASFRQATGDRIIRRSLDGLGWFGDWLVDEDLPPSHPFAIRIAEALKIAWSSQIADPHASLVLAERLGVPVDIAIDMVSRHLERSQA